MLDSSTINKKATKKNLRLMSMLRLYRNFAIAKNISTLIIILGILLFLVNPFNYTTYIPIISFGVFLFVIFMVVELWYIITE